MRLIRAIGAALVIAMMPLAIASAQTVKVGLIVSFTGQNASLGIMMDQAVKLWMKEHEKNLPPGVKVEIIRRDDTGPNPEVAKRLATELITRDKVDIITGVQWTPNAMAIAPLATEAKVPVIVMNAGTSMITTASPYIARTSFTVWQACLPLGEWAPKNNLKRAFIAVSDFAPGHDAQEAFTRGFTASGGQIIEAVRMPIATQDFAPFMQRARDARPEAVFAFVPASVQATSLMKSFGDVGLKQAGVKLIGTGDLTPDEELANMGDVSLGAITMLHYSAAATRPANQAFIQAWKREYGQNSVPSFPAIGAWDAMAAIFYVILEQRGRMNGDKTMELLKGWKSDQSPRGPIMIDPETRDVVHNEYLREVRRVDGTLVNIELETIPMVKDPWKVINNRR